MARFTLGLWDTSLLDTPESARYTVGAFASALFFLLSAGASVPVLLLSDFEGMAVLAKLILPAFSCYFLADALVSYRKARAHST